MDNQLVSKRYLVITFIFSLLAVLVVFVRTNLDRTTKVVFCDVGQGDAIYLRIKNQVDVLIDAGPDRKILDCLGRHMPFFDKKIELAIISHPDKDHIGGFLPVTDHYRLNLIYSIPVSEPTLTFSQLLTKIKKNKITVFQPFAGYQIRILNDFFTFYWPPKNIRLDTNDLSLIFLFQEKDFKILFTGDISLPILERVLKQSKIKTTILKIPHHGSKYNLSKTVLLLADPTMAVISCGKKNPYGHPAQEVLDMLKAAKIKVRRTDKEGDIIFKINPNVK
jgi:competence protein ComEC